MSTTAIIIFADAASDAARHKKLVSDPERNRQLFAQLNRDIISRAKNAGLVYFVYNESIDDGHVAGEYIADVIEAVYAMGYEHVIIAWNNCMCLNDTMMHQAVEELQHVPLVVGPAHWGGVYLVGVARSIFNRRSFITLNWYSNLLAGELSCYHRDRVVLPRLRVLNGPYSMRIMTIAHVFEEAGKQISALHIGSLWARIKVLFAKLRQEQPQVKVPAGTTK